MRQWYNDDVVPLFDDVFQERLYCIRYVHTWIADNGKAVQERYFVAPSPADVGREQRVPVSAS